MNTWVPLPRMQKGKVLPTATRLASAFTYQKKKKKNTKTEAEVGGMKWKWDKAYSNN